jgi:hyperosmotically inducible protein
MKPGLFLLPFALLAGCARTGAADAADPPAVGSADSQDAGNPIDITISDRVRQALLGDRNLAPDAGVIRVATRDGVVKLAGFARTEELKQRASLVARAVGSVARVDNRLVVDPEAVRAAPPMEGALDHTISYRVRMALLDDRAIAAEARTVRILTQDGVVHLSGSVGSEAARTRMGVVANAVGSVKRVVNELQVKSP